MKILKSISDIYIESKPLAEKLKSQVDQTILHNKNEGWHYFSRIKSEESFALKLETGRVKDPIRMEDLFACTLVVENINEIKNAVSFFDSHFIIHDRRPKSDNFTHKQSSSFQFDDLRLYVTLKKVEYLPKGNLTTMTFEIQVKTFLQHAWSIATHDLIYKSEKVSWSKERVAFQVKAMLEQAEISISGADSLSDLPELAKNNYESNVLNEIKVFLLDTFPRESLPFDLLRLCRIINDILNTFKIELIHLRRIVDAETKANRGAKTLDLSPYGIIIQSMINQEKDMFQKVFKHGARTQMKGIFLPPEILTTNIVIEDDSKAVRIK